MPNPYGDLDEETLARAMRVFAAIREVVGCVERKAGFVVELPEDPNEDQIGQIQRMVDVCGKCTDKCRAFQILRERGKI